MKSEELQKRERGVSRFSDTLITKQRQRKISSSINKLCHFVVLLEMPEYRHCLHVIAHVHVHRVFFPLLFLFLLFAYLE